MQWRPLDGEVLSSSGGLFPKDRLERVCQVFGGTHAKLGSRTTWVVTGERPGQRAIEALQAKKPALKVTSWSELFDCCTPDPEVFSAWLGSDRASLRDWVWALGVRNQHLPEGLRATGVPDAPDLRFSADGLDLTGVQGLGAFELSGNRIEGSGALLSGWKGLVRLKDSRFVGATLRDLQIRGSFTRCDLREAVLEGAVASFEQCDLRGATLAVQYSGLDGCDLRGAVLEGAWPTERASVVGCDFRDTDLRGARFGSCEGCDFSGATLAVDGGAGFGQGNRFVNTDFTTSVLIAFDGRSVDLTGAKLEHADTRLALLEPVTPWPADEAGLLETSLGLSARTHPDIEIRALVPDSGPELVFRFPGTRRSLAFTSVAELLGAIRQLGLVRDSSPIRSVYRELSTPEQAVAAQAWAAALGFEPVTRAPSTRPACLAIPEALVQCVLEDREGQASWAVLADWLAEQGDARGKLISQELETPPDRLETLRLQHLAQHQTAILGARPVVDPSSVRIRRGFVDRLRVDSKVSDARLRKFAAHPSSQLLRALHVTTGTGRTRGLVALLTQRPIEELRLENCAEAIEALPPCPSVRVLTQRDFSSKRPLHEYLPNLRAVWGSQSAATLDGLKLEFVSTWATELGGIDASRVRILRVEGPVEPADLERYQELREIHLSRAEATPHVRAWLAQREITLIL